MARIHEHRVNLAAPLTLVSAIPLAMQGDSEADELKLHVLRGRETADMSGYTVGGYLERADGIRVMLKGSVTADVVEVKLQEACYRVPGAYKAFVRLTKTTGEKMTLFLFAGYIESEGDGEIVDEEDTLPSVEELIAMIEEIDRAIKEANAATTGADAAAAEALKAAENAGRAEKAASDAAYEANAAADAADEAAVGASAWAKATMEAELLPEGSTPTIAVGKNESGGNVIRVGIPAGRTGEAGVTPQITFEVETGAAGSAVKVKQSGTAEAPHIKLTIPRGDTGAVEGVDYYEGDPEPLGEANPGTANGLSRGNHVHPMPTAKDVGARPNTWTPTAEDVGALPSDGTAADSAKLGGKAPEYYLQPINLLDNSDFRNPVNQRGYVNGSAVESWSHFIDRWLNTTETARTFTLNDSGLSIGADTVIQQKVAGIKEGTPVTFAACDGNGAVHVVSATVTYLQDGSWVRLATNDAEDFDLHIETFDGLFQVIIYSGNATTWRWVALYEGSYTVETLPPYVPKGYAVELAECQRYFIAFPTYGSYAIPFAHGDATGETTARVELTLPVPMRIINPSITADNVTWYVRSAGKSTQATVAVLYSLGNKLTLTATVAEGLTNYQQATLAYYGQTGKTLYICFSADL